MMKGWLEMKTRKNKKEQEYWKEHFIKEHEEHRTCKYNLSSQI